jgi:hypothetical protein
MSWEFLVAVVVAIPLIMFPAVFVWYVNGSGLYHALRHRMSVHGSKRPVAAQRGAAVEADKAARRAP